MLSPTSRTVAMKSTLSDLSFLAMRLRGPEGHPYSRTAIGPKQCPAAITAPDLESP